MMGAALRRTPATLPGVGVSLLPTLMCPACWPAYAGIVWALGLGFLVSTKYLLPLTVTFLSISILPWVFALRTVMATALSGWASPLG